MSVVYANKGGGGLSNLFKMALSTFGGPVGQIASAAWSAAEGNPVGAIAGLAGAGGAGGQGSDFFKKLFWSKNFAGQVPKSAYNMAGWGPWVDTNPLGMVR